MESGRWYTEIYPSGVAPPVEQEPSDFDTMLERLKAFKARTDDPKAIFRVLAPATATRDQLQQITTLGAQLI